MAGLFRVNSTSAPPPTAGFVDNAGVSFSALCYKTEQGGGGINISSNSAISNGDTIVVGKGTTPATRSDFKIEVPFTDGSVLDDPLLMQGLGYIPNSGFVTKNTLITPTTTNGVINEVVKEVELNSEPAVIHKCIFMRNVVNPPASFVAGQAINIEEKISF